MAFKRRPSFENEDVNTQACKTFISYMETKSKAQSKDVGAVSCDAMFTKSLEEQLGRLDPNKKSLAKLKIQQVLHEIEFGVPQERSLTNDPRHVYHHAGAYAGPSSYHQEGYFENSSSYYPTSG